MAPLPTFLTAPSPNRIRFASSTVNLYPDSFTSGGSTSIPSSRASLMNLTTESVSPMDDERMAAMKSAGKCALRYAV